MHTQAAQAILNECRGRSNRGEDVTKANATCSPEVYEECIIQLGHERDIRASEVLTNLGEALKKVCPEAVPMIVKAHAEYNKKIAEREEAFNRLLAVLRS
jgi:hypothetical protein